MVLQVALNVNAQPLPNIATRLGEEPQGPEQHNAAAVLWLLRYERASGVEGMRVVRALSPCRCTAVFRLESGSAGGQCLG